MNPHDDLEAYVLGALENAEAAAFETHVASCSACRDGVASYGGVLRALRALPVAAPPPAPRVRRTHIGWIAAVAAAAVLGIAIGQRTVPARADGDVAAIAEMIAVQPREIALAGTSARGTAIVGTGGARTAFIVSGLPAPPRGPRISSVGARCEGAFTRHDASHERRARSAGRPRRRARGRAPHRHHGRAGRRVTCAHGPCSGDRQGLVGAIAPEHAGATRLPRFARVTLFASGLPYRGRRR